MQKKRKVKMDLSLFLHLFTFGSDGLVLSSLVSFGSFGLWNARWKKKRKICLLSDFVKKWFVSLYLYGIWEFDISYFFIYLVWLGGEKTWGSLWCSFAKTTNNVFSFNFKNKFVALKISYIAEARLSRSLGG